MPATIPNARSGRLLLGCLVLTLCMLAPSAGAAQSAKPVGESDQSVIHASARGDKATIESLLDADFEWINAEGLRRNRTETLSNLPAFAANTFGESAPHINEYDHMVVLAGDRFGLRFMRIWVQRPDGWRLFAMIHTSSTGGAAPFSAPADGNQQECDNPCRTIPFNPSTPAQKEMLDTFKRLKTDEWHPNPDDWAPWVLDDVSYVSSAATLSKADRVNRLAQQKKNGATSQPGDPVESMQIVEFGNSAVMFARHTPFGGGKSYYSVRVWVLRDGKWRFGNSQQTTIEPGPPKNGLF
jgi:hypothetical protein